MSDFQASVVLPRPRQEVFEYLRRPANLLKMFPAEKTSRLWLKHPDIISVGECIEFKVKAMGAQFLFVHEVTELADAELIVIKQIEGPFKAWSQEQHFADSGNGNTLLTSVVQFDPPGGMLGFVVTRKVVMSQLENWVSKGHQILQQHLANPTG
ncbi:hypothetical protein [Schlesneria sp. T3-172]|uniref:hypothetical protein n=1 Tax=Schlesneria sphaerica TaxID=3373610 RepID=UPI0037C906E4